MESMEKKKSKYIKDDNEKKVFHATGVFFFFCMFVMPQYFGIPVPLFDLTALRIALLAVLFMIFVNPARTREFWNLVFGSKFIKVFIPYFFVIIYTMVLRHDFKAFFNPFMEIFAFVMLIYVIKDSLGVEKTIHLIIVFCYVLSILGIVEYMMGKSPFSYLETIDGVLTGSFVRSGQYRIMSAQIHSLGYGLMLVTCVPFLALDLQNSEIYFFQRPVLLILFGLNIVLTGSRSTLGIFFLELFLILLFSTKRANKKVVFYIIPFLLLIAVAIIGLQNTGIGKYLLLQITTVLDSVFGTSFSARYGADISSLNASSDYRDQLKYIFTVKWLNPLLGIGRSRAFISVVNGTTINSVDDFYIAEYIRYAYPGMIAYIFILLFYMVNIWKEIREKKSVVAKVVLIGTVGYVINIYWVDSLQTLKYLYILFAVFICSFMENTNSDTAKQKDYFGRGKSRYIKE